MDKEKFKHWLSGTMSVKAANDCISRCSNIERHLKVNLDDEFHKDRGESVIKMLEYSKTDDNQNQTLRNTLAVQGNMKFSLRLSSFRSVIKKYFRFCSEREQ